MSNYFIQLIKRPKGRKNKLKGLMRPAGRSLAMSDMVQYFVFQNRNKWEDFTGNHILVQLAWKGVRKVANFPIATFAIYKQFFNILGTENKNKNWKRPFLTKYMIFKNFHSLALSGQNAIRGKIFIIFLFLPVPARWNPPIRLRLGGPC